MLFFGDLATCLPEIFDFGVPAVRLQVFGEELLLPDLHELRENLPLLGGEIDARLKLTPRQHYQRVAAATLHRLRNGVELHASHRLHEARIDAVAIDEAVAPANLVRGDLAQRGTLRDDGVERAA